MVREWARDENDPDKRRRGLDELEHYRLAFKYPQTFLFFRIVLNPEMKLLVLHHSGIVYECSLTPAINNRDSLPHFEISG